MDKYNHIEIQKEDNTYLYRGRKNPVAPKPPDRDKTKHGQKLKNQISNTYNNILKNRKDNGINSENLIVLELESDAISEDVLQLMQNKFNMYLVEETQTVESTSKSKLIVQFESKTDIDRFNAEREYWETDNK